jgi:hypothetical protein
MDIFLPHSEYRTQIEVGEPNEPSSGFKCNAIIRLRSQTQPVASLGMLDLYPGTRGGSIKLLNEINVLYAGISYGSPLSNRKKGILPLLLTVFLCTGTL